MKGTQVTVGSSIVAAVLQNSNFLLQSNDLIFD